jgi:prepilin-type N-terminal cleavage/methylation domain-containing protein
MKHITRKNQQHAQSGFTLIELSISLVIIGLLVTSVVAATKARDNSILNSIMEDMNKLSFAFNGFKTIYLSIPGDFATATNTFSASTIADGNGNGYIDNNTAESVLALQHLALGGMIAGSYCNNWTKSATCLNYMPSRAAKNTDGFYFASTSSTPGANFSVFDKNTNSSYNSMVVYARLFDSNSNAIYDQLPAEATYAILSPKDAFMLDNKYDDAKPQTGNLIAADGSNTSGGCLSGSSYLITTKAGCYIANIISN